MRITHDKTVAIICSVVISRVFHVIGSGRSNAVCNEIWHYRTIQIDRYWQELSGNVILIVILSKMMFSTMLSGNVLLQCGSYSGNDVGEITFVIIAPPLIFRSVENIVPLQDMIKVVAKSLKLQLHYLES